MIYEIMVDGWKIRGSEWISEDGENWSYVALTGSNGQEATLRRDGVLDIEVHDDEIGYGLYEGGDAARNRTIPLEVLAAAMTMWKTVMKKSQDNGFESAIRVQKAV